MVIPTTLTKYWRRHNVLLCFIFSYLAAPLRSLGEGDIQPDDGGPVLKSEVEGVADGTRSIQMPLFKNGKWLGYQNEILSPDRKPSSVPLESAAPAPGHTPTPSTGH